MSKTIASLAVLACLGVGLQACGESNDRPSAEDLSSSLADAGIEADTSDCVADKLLDSDLSDKQLNAVKDDDNSDLSDDEEKEIGDVLGDAAASCVSG